MIKKIEEISLNAWPAIETVAFDGWIARFANGVTKRSNSVHAIRHIGENVFDKIRFCEDFYRRRKFTPTFKMSEISEPCGIDSILESLGYSREFEVSVKLKNLSGIKGSPEGSVRISVNPDNYWLDNYIRMNEADVSQKATLSVIMEKIALAKCFLTLHSENIPVGCGLGVVEDRFIGLYDIVIDKSYRNMGFGVSLIENLLFWGRSQDAELAYLQVLSDNKPAVNLYQKLGFREEYVYWYRIKKD